jgi:hypothetical protein
MTGVSGGHLGDHRVDAAIAWVQQHGTLEQVREFVTIGREPRAGHDRDRWASVDWDAYRAQVGVQQRSGPWRIEAAEHTDLSAWIAEAEGMPPGTAGAWYTTLVHDQGGVIMSDVPAEIAGALPFLDYVEALPALDPVLTGGHRTRVLIGGLGLGIIPARLLKHSKVSRIDVVEIDPDVAEMVTQDRYQQYAPNAWASDPRLHIYLGDIHTWHPHDAYRHGQYKGCMLHPRCPEIGKSPWWDAAWFDIWDRTSAGNLPSMQKLTRRYARRAKPSWCWERAECEAMKARGQTEPFPDHLGLISETGY